MNDDGTQEPPKLKLRRHGKPQNNVDIVVTGVLADRIDASGRRRLSLNAKEKRGIKKVRMINQAVAMFLDLEHSHSWKEMAIQLGISEPGLKDLTKTQEFMDAYSQYFVELGSDPRVRSSQNALADMLPEAITQLRNMLLEPRTPAMARLQVIKEIIKLNGLDAPTS
jgi:hypothetical protein